MEKIPDKNTVRDNIKRGKSGGSEIREATQGIMSSKLFVICLIAFLVFVPQCAFTKSKQPRYQTMIRYSSPNWLGNDRIICAKYISRIKLHYGFLANITNSGTESLTDELQIISMKIDGTDEKIIKSVMTWPKKGRSSEGALIGFAIIYDITYSPSRKLIAFNTQQGKLYLMNEDGTNLGVLVKPAGGPIFSPDDRYLQYTSNYKVWLYDLDTGEHKVLIENAVGGPWSPDAKKIAFSRKADDRPSVYEFDIETGKESVKDSARAYINDWLLNGESAPKEFRTFLISPDRKHIVGEPYSNPGKDNRLNYIGISNIDGSNFKVIKNKAYE